MKVIVENYGRAKSPLNSSSIVSLCEERTSVYCEDKKKEVVIDKLFLLCTATGTRFSNQEIENMNRERINEAIAEKHRTRKSKNKKNEE